VSDEIHVTIGEPAADGDAEHGAQAPPAPAAPTGGAAEPGSVLDELAAQARARASEVTEVFPVGRQDGLRLWARYRVLDDDTVEDIAKGAQQRAKLAARVIRDDVDLKQLNLHYAIVIATACVELLYATEDGTLKPLRELLEREQPLRYDRTLLAAIPAFAEILDLDAATATPTEIVMALHMIGPPEARSLGPLRARGQQLDEWMAQTKDDARKETLEGH
jgi:hypothetical protein